MFSRILVPFDGSTGSEAALRQAIELARLCESALTILTVYRHHSMLEASFSMVRPGDPGNMDDIMRGHATEVAMHAKRIAVEEEGLTGVRAFVKAGPPARTIAAFAKRHEYELIVIGSRGVGSVEGYFLGSVPQKVTGLTTIPVLIV